MTTKLHRRISFSRRAQDERGSSLVEMALSMAILLSAVFGVLAFGLAGYSYLFVSEVARDATRYAIVRGNSHAADCTAPGNADCIAQTGSSGDIQAYVQSLALPGIKSSNLSAATTYLTSAGGACGTSDVCKVPGDLVQTTVTYSLPLAIPFVSQKTVSVSSTSQMVISY